MTCRRCRRVGIVRAARLTAPLAWTTSQGAIVHGDTGDWLVRSAAAGRRTIAAATFPRLYEWVTADTYRAIGEVDARPAEDGEPITTLEGLVHALTGDWVITDDAGDSWPVSDRVFRATYVEIT